MTMRNGDRGQAITLNYTLGLGIAVILATGLLIAGANFVSGQREAAAGTEMQVVGQQVAADIEAVDRLVNGSDDPQRVSVTRNVPRTIAGSSYTIEIEGQGDPYLLLRTTNPKEEVRIEFTNQTAVRTSSVSGGEVTVNYTAAGELALEPGDGT